MSGLAGVVDLAGKGINRDTFAGVVSRIAYRGPDGVRIWQGRGAAMAFAKFARTPDAMFDDQPLHDAESSTCVTFDGRLDNRDDLAAQLNLRLSDEVCDVALVAAAYARWGIDCAVRLLGDFALAIWDGRERRLFVARDVMGLRPLFFREINGGWWWASDQRALVELGMPRINEGFVAEHLSGRITSIDETIYEGISRLPMAHAAVVANGTFRSWRYWRPDPDATLKYRDPRDVEQHYRSLLREAVRARLRVAGRAAIMLSGGIDSSSVAVEIARLRGEGHPIAADVKAFTMTVPGRPENEEPVVREVLERVPLPCDMLPAQELPEHYFRDDAAAALDLPQPPSASLGEATRVAAVAEGRSIFFTGYGGDDWFESSYADVGELLRRGRLLASTTRLLGMTRVRNNSTASQLLHLGLWSALPQGAKHVVRRALRRTPVPEWIEPRFARACGLADRLYARPDVVEFDSLVQYDTFRNATCGGAGFGNDLEERYNAAFGVEQRHPLHDRRLIELALLLPAELRCSHGVSKALMRRAMSADLPASVTASPANDDFGFLGLLALSRLGGTARLLESAPVTRGWVRATAVRTLYRGLEDGVTRCLWPLCTAMGVDFWLRALDDAGRSRPMGDDDSEAFEDFTIDRGQHATHAGSASV